MGTAEQKNTETDKTTADNLLLLLTLLLLLLLLLLSLLLLLLLTLIRWRLPHTIIIIINIIIIIKWWREEMNHGSLYNCPSARPSKGAGREKSVHGDHRSRLTCERPNHEGVTWRCRIWGPEF